MSFVYANLGLAFFLSEVGLAWWKRSKRVPGASEQDDGSLRLLWRVIGVAMTVGILLSAYGVGPFLSRSVIWQFVALLVFALGTLVRWWAIYHLGRFFTVDVAVASDHRLVDTGPYRFVRHPSYTGLMLQFTGLALALNNLFSLLVILAPIFWALSRRMTVEERALAASLGPVYLAYTRRAKRLLPGVY